MAFLRTARRPVWSKNSKQGEKMDLIIREVTEALIRPGMLKTFGFYFE